jgi:hypothetical protein
MPQHGDEPPYDVVMPQHEDQPPHGVVMPQHGDQPPHGVVMPQHGDQPPHGVVMPQLGEIPPQLVKHAGFLQQLLNLGLVLQQQRRLVIVTDPRDIDQDEEAPDAESLGNFESVGFLYFYLRFSSVVASGSGIGKNPDPG